MTIHDDAEAGVLAQTQLAVVGTQHIAVRSSVAKRHFAVTEPPRALGRLFGVSQAAIGG